LFDHGERSRVDVLLPPYHSLKFPACSCVSTALRKDHRGVDLISDALPLGGLWYARPGAVSNAVCYAEDCKPVSI